MFEKNNFKTFFISSALVFLFLPFLVSAVAWGERVNFSVDPGYDLFGREEISATLQRTGTNVYFYTDDSWIGILDDSEREEVNKAILDLEKEFSSKIYPDLTSVFGFEWKPGIDKDDHITVLIHQMRDIAGGYFNDGDEYSKFQIPASNEREMVYLNANRITSSLAKSFLAHEFTHLITFNQKEKQRGVSEEVWFNEARAEYAPAILGYNQEYQGSVLQSRTNYFLAASSDSICEWQNLPADYGVLNLFTQYLVDQYGEKVLFDSMKTEKVGIESINQALTKNGYNKDFSQVFTDWTIAVLVNDCGLGNRYCYKNSNLRDLRVVPSTNFLPLSGKSILSVSKTTKNWAGNWFKFVGGKGENLNIKFIGNPEVLFKVPYVVKKVSGEHTIGFFQLDDQQRGEVSFSEFGKEKVSVIIAPSIQSKVSGFLNPEQGFSFFWQASSQSETELNNEPLKESLLNQIAHLKKQIAELQAKIQAVLANPISNQDFKNNLYYGMRDNSEVKRLQIFLKEQGEEIYPEALLTGNFLDLTKKAVIRFQQKYAPEILQPLGLKQGTGFVGSKTREKIKQILNSQ